MTQWIELREALSDIYRRQDYWLLPLLRAASTFIILLTAVTKFTEGLPGGGMFLLIFMSVLASFLPWSVIPLEAAVLLLYCIYKSSLELAVSAAIFFLIIMLVQTAFRGGHAVLIAVMPLFFILKIPFLLPVIAGLSFSLVAAVPIALGTLVYYFLRTVQLNYGTETVGRDVEEMASRYGELFLDYIGNQGMIVVLLSLVLCFLIVFVVRNLPVDYSWSIAVGAGLLCSFLTLIIGNRFTSGSDFSVVSAFLSILLSLILSFVFIFFVHDADYRRTEKIQFEDDSYFYYVKAVPKRRPRQDDERRR